MALKFDYLKNIGDTIGMAIDVPYSDQFSTGFGWELNKDYFTYTALGFLWDNTAQTATQDNTWLCSNTISRDNTTQQGYCYNFMPTDGVSATEYRYSKTDKISVWGWANISNTASVFTIGDSLVLLSASTYVIYTTVTTFTTLAVAF